MLLLSDAPPSWWARTGEITHVLVDLTIVTGGIVAVVKYRVLHLFSPRWRSVLECTHYELPNGSLVFTADYSITNTGQRPLAIGEVRLRVLHVLHDGALLLPDEDRAPIAERVLRPSDIRARGNFRIESGERTIFPIRCHLTDLPDAVLVYCEFNHAEQRLPALLRSFSSKPERPPTLFRGFYCRYPAATGNPKPETRNP